MFKHIHFQSIDLADAPWEPGTRWAIIHDSEGNMILIQTVKER